MAPHTRHQGSRISWAGRRSSVHMTLLYQLWYVALSFRRVCLGGGRCLSHQPSRVSSGQPGWRQGRRARLAMGYHLHVCKNKNAGTSNPPLWVFTGSGVLRSGLWQYPLAWRSYSPGSKSPGSPPWCLAGCAAVAGFFGTPGTQAIRLSLSTVYHESQVCAILFPPFLRRCQMQHLYFKYMYTASRFEGVRLDIRRVPIGAEGVPHGVLLRPCSVGRHGDLPLLGLALLRRRQLPV